MLAQGISSLSTVSNKQPRAATNGLVVVAAGNEVIQYMPAEDFSSLYDINDLMSSYQTMVDPNSLDNTVLTTPTDEDVLESLYLMQPGTKTTQNGRQTEMEDVD